MVFDNIAVKHENDIEYQCVLNPWHTMAALSQGSHGVLKILEHRVERSTIANNAVASRWHRLERDRTPRDGACFEHA